MIFDTASITTRKKNAPRTVPGIVPTPPDSEQPPTTAAAIAFNSCPLPWFTGAATDSLAT